MPRDELRSSAAATPARCDSAAPDPSVERVLSADSNYLINRKARQRFADPAVKADNDANRPAVERVHAQMKRKMNSSKVRYRGIAKNAIYYSAIAATWNLRVLLRNGLRYFEERRILVPT